MEENSSDTEPHRHQKRVREKGNWVYRIVIFLIYLYAKIFFRFTVRYIDWKAIQKVSEGPFIIAPNHVSYLDPPIIAASWPSALHFFASEHLFHQSKFFSWLLGKLNSHPVNREHGVRAIIDAIRMLQKDRKPIVVFPEGTRSEDGVVKSELEEGVAFMSIKAGCPIIPSYIHGTYDIWPKNAALPKFFGKVSVVYGSPIFPQAFLQKGREQIEAVSKALQTQLDILSQLSQESGDSSLR